ncbi:recombinase family protein [Uliginosibacterium sp. 31-16]|uniref:recombinase family protein n=1 Tax=Uliginosibacterium sp. 31-16 TaxID=3068315 RepID=UPI00273FF91C|nr:recombinase family protein [Uliginosibacterium sp. 31-16]MDP5239942.1 recombinase family protein [Uliginosibacterium sp. 31-16]
MNRAISYLRWSSPEQAKGDSLRRQLEATQQYCKEHDLVLDTTIRDEGISAYDKSNLNGAFGSFLAAVRAGRIQVGTTLIVESLDRMSRAKPIDALHIFLEIIRAGIRVVTLTDQQVYTTDTLTDDFSKLIISIVVMQRAHEESATKSKRVGAAWANKKKLVKENGKLLTRRCPNWLKPNADFTAFEFVPGRKETVEFIVQESLRGVGNNSVMRQLNEKGVLPWSKSGIWQQSYVQKILSSPALYGAIDIDGELIEDYYPHVMTKDEWHHMRADRDTRRTTKANNRKGTLLTNLYSGLLKCGYCGSTMSVAGYKERRNGYERKYVGCRGARTGNTKCKHHSWFIDEFERSFLFHISSLDYTRVFGQNDQSQELEDAKVQLAGLLAKQADIAKKIENLISMIEDAPNKTLLTQLAKREEEQADVATAIKTLQQQVNTLQSRVANRAGRMQILVKLFKELQHPKSHDELRVLRETLFTAIHDIVKQIDMYPSGNTVDGTKDDRYAIITYFSDYQQRLDADQFVRSGS